MQVFVILGEFASAAKIVSLCRYEDADGLTLAGAIWAWSAHLRAGQRQSSTRCINKPDTRKRLAYCLALDKEKSLVAGGVHTRRPWVFETLRLKLTAAVTHE